MQCIVFALWTGKFSRLEELNHPQAPLKLTLNAKEAAQFMKWQNKFTRDRTGEIQLLVKSMK